MKYNLKQHATLNNMLVIQQNAQCAKSMASGSAKIYAHLCKHCIEQTTPKYLPNKNKKENQEKITLFFAKQI